MRSRNIRHYVIVALVDDEQVTITQEELDSIEFNLEEGWDVESFINRVLEEREQKK